MNKWVKIGIGAALLWYGVLRGAKGLIVKVRDYSFKSVDVATGTVSLYLNFLVKNPLFVGLTLKGIAGDVYAYGQKVGTVNTTLEYYLSGRHTHIIPVVVNLEIGRVLALIQAGQSVHVNIMASENKNKSITVAFDGKLYVGSWSVAIPIQIDLDYTI